MSEREPGAATALIFGLLEEAMSAQRDGGTIVDVTAKLTGDAAKAVGLAGEGEITLRLWPCVTPTETARDRKASHG